MAGQTYAGGKSHSTEHTLTSQSNESLRYSSLFLPFNNTLKSKTSHKCNYCGCHTQQAKSLRHSRASLLVHTSHFLQHTVVPFFSALFVVKLDIHQPRHFPREHPGQGPCGGLNKNVPHKLLYSWFPAGGTLRGGLEGVALLEEGCH